MKIKSIGGRVGLWCAFLAAGTWVLPLGAWLAVTPIAGADSPEHAASSSGQLAVTGEYVLNRDAAITEADLLRAHSEAFFALFNEAWDPQHWAYPLFERVTGPGRYAGQNYRNQDFMLTVTQWVPVDLAAAPISPEYRDIVRTREVTMASTMAVLATRNARIHMFGVVISRNSSSGVSEWAFLPFYFADPGDPLFANGSIAPRQGAAGIDDNLRNDTPPIDAADQGSVCIQEAITRYESAVIDCNSVYNNAVRDCNTTHILTVATHNATFATSNSTAHAAWEDCME
jgi:hypothetical protein